MLTYFLITWVVAFFALCLPLLFITEKEKEAMRKTKDEIWYEGQKKIPDEYNKEYEKYKEEYHKIISEHYIEYSKLIKKREDILFRTSMLNFIFLFILPYVIYFKVENSYYIISLLYFIIIILFIGMVLIALGGATMGGGGGEPSYFDKLIYNLFTLIFYGPGKFVLNLAVK
jgi:preprotein translocase subunit SecG